MNTSEFCVSFLDRRFANVEQLLRVVKRSFTIVFAQQRGMLKCRPEKYNKNERKEIPPKMASFLTYLTTRPFLFESENELIVMREFCLCSLRFVHIYFVITSLKEKRVNRICSRITGISLRVAAGNLKKKLIKDCVGCFRQNFKLFLILFLVVFLWIAEFLVITTMGGAG
jgi:hypothetical protein